MTRFKVGDRVKINMPPTRDTQGRVYEWRQHGRIGRIVEIGEVCGGFNYYVRFRGQPGLADWMHGDSLRVADATT